MKTWEDVKTRVQEMTREELRAFVLQTMAILYGEASREEAKVVLNFDKEWNSDTFDLISDAIVRYVGEVEDPAEFEPTPEPTEPDPDVVREQEIDDHGRVRPGRWVKR